MQQHREHAAGGAAVTSTSFYRITDEMRGSREVVSYGLRSRGWNKRYTRLMCRDEKETLSSRPVRKTDDFRHWVHVSEEPPFCKNNFVFLSYNILSVDNARDHWRDLYYHIPTRFMNWDWRKWRLVQELGLWSPDLMCLQEVDRFNDLQEELDKRGYAGVYKARTGLSSDGCAMFWRRNRFQLLQEENIQYKDHDLRDNVAQLCVFKTIPKEMCRHTTNTVYQGAFGSAHGRTYCVVVANIHVLFNPKRGDIKLGQVRILLERAYALSVQWGGAPVIIAGDFNSTPQSPLYEFLANSELDISGLDRRTISGQKEQESFNPTYQSNEKGVKNEEVQSTSRTIILLSDSEEPNTIEDRLGLLGGDGEGLENDGLSDQADLVEDQNTLSRTHDADESVPPAKRHLSGGNTNYQWSPEELQAATGQRQCMMVSHKLKLRSAYSEVQGNSGTRDSKGEPLVTTYHRKFMGTVDYIWHTEGLDTLRVLDILPVDTLRRTRGLPNYKWGSDHMALACELAFYP